MPRRKELEQLPMANTLPSMGDNHATNNRESARGFTEEEVTKPIVRNNKKLK